MLFAIGSKVRLRFTGEIGTVTARLDEGMLQIRLENDPDFLIPAFEEDLMRVEEFSAAKPSFIPGGKVPTIVAPPPRQQMSMGKPAATPAGLQLCFEPMMGRDDIITRYKVWLLNDTPYEFLFEFDLFTDERDVVVLDDKINAATLLELGDFLSDDLNDSPEALLSVQRITTAGLDERIEHSHKIRPKSFFSQLVQVPLLPQPVYRFVLIAKFNTGEKKDDIADLKAYAKQHTRKPQPDTQGSSRPFKAFNIEEFANFDPEIDLHIETLLNGSVRMDKSEILRVQMVHFQRFMEKSVRLGVAKVFIIHGVGEGKLRDAIAERLRDNPNVKKFKNEFHPKYGYGATEVIFD
jgi:hypothetical protein